jgi:hypothetical protein
MCNGRIRIRGISYRIQFNHIIIHVFVKSYFIRYIIILVTLIKML